VKRLVWEIGPDRPPPPLPLTTGPIILRTTRRRGNKIRPAKYLLAMFRHDGDRFRALRGLLLTAALVAALPAWRLAGEEPHALHVLFIGNSLTYFNELPIVFAAMAAAAGQVPPVCHAVVGPGYSLQDHWEQGAALKAIEQGTWDYVVLQQGPSGSSEGRTMLLRYSRKFVPAIRKAGAKPVFFMVWPNATRWRDFSDAADSYRFAAKDSDGLLVPVGEAWHNAVREDPDVPLYRRDDMHPTPTGTYLASLVFVGDLYERSPIGLPSSLDLPNGKRVDIPPETAKMLQQAAQDALEKFPPAK
jgi:hypothetical protein